MPLVRCSKSVERFDGLTPGASGQTFDHAGVKVISCRAAHRPRSSTIIYDDVAYRASDDCLTRALSALATG